MNGIAIARIAKIFALLGFFLPWVLVSCSGQPVASISGIALATGDTAMRNPITGVIEYHHSSPNLLVLLAAVVIVGGLALSLNGAGRRDPRQAARVLLTSAALAAALCLAGVLSLYSDREREIARAEAGNAFTGGIAGLVQIHTQYGLWWTLLGLVVYYRGVHRADGRRGPAEYVGAGRIGAIWLDPNTEGRGRKAWYCAVEDYRRFGEPVAAKHGGVNLEDIPANLWRDGIRVLDAGVYDRIVAQGGGGLPSAAPAVPSLTIRTSDNLIVPTVPGAGQSQTRSFRRSARAKAIGDRAEAIALRYISEQVLGAHSLVHRAAQSETPGWDIDYLDDEGRLQLVEVKGTEGGGFRGVEVTAGELRAAKRHGPDYWLYLVAGCASENATVQAIRDPAARIASGDWSATPSIISVRFASAKKGRELTNPWTTSPLRSDATLLIVDYVELVAELFGNGAGPRQFEPVSSVATDALEKEIPVGPDVVFCPRDGANDMPMNHDDHVEATWPKRQRRSSVRENWEGSSVTRPRRAR